MKNQKPKKKIYEQRKENNTMGVSDFFFHFTNFSSSLVVDDDPR